MNKHLLPVAAVLALASAGAASAATASYTFNVQALSTTFAPNATNGAYGGALGPVVLTPGHAGGGIGTLGTITLVDSNLIFAPSGPTVSFNAPANTVQVDIEVFDAGFPGDVYQVFLGTSIGGNNPSLGTCPACSAPGQSSATPLQDTTPNDMPLSTAEWDNVGFTVGTNYISAADILMQYQGQVSPYGYAGDVNSPTDPFPDPNSGVVQSDVSPAAFVLAVQVITEDVPVVPEPISLSIVATGLIGLGLARRKHNKKQ